MKKIMETHAIKVERGIKNGIRFCTVTCDGEIADAGISRRITGTTYEEGSGIFCGNFGWANADGKGAITFRYGDQCYECPATVIDYATYDIETIRDEIANRARLVRAWVASVDVTETLEASFTL